MAVQVVVFSSGVRVFKDQFYFVVWRKKKKNLVKPQCTGIATKIQHFFLRNMGPLIKVPFLIFQGRKTIQERKLLFNHQEVLTAETIQRKIVFKGGIYMR